MKKMLAVLPLFILLVVLGCGLPGTGSNGQQAFPRVVAKNVPSDIGSLTLTVSGPGLTTVELVYATAPGSLVLELPAGPDRKFELTVNVGGAANAATVYEGQATVNLERAETTDVAIDMRVTQTKLVIPDYLNYRIVMIDNMNGDGWMELGGSDLGFSPSSNFRPYDVAIDGRGRIYIANAYGAPDGGVFRIDNMADTTRETITTRDSIQALAIDDINGYIYYIASGTTPLYRKRLDPLGGEESFDLTAESEVTFLECRGLSVDQSGMVYLANSSENKILKINPNLPAGSRVLSTFVSPNIDDPWDVMVNSGYVYVTNWSGLNGYKIVRLSTDLTGPQSFGDSNSSSSPIQGEFWGPRRFIAVLNRKITLTDEYDSFTNYDSLLSFDNIQGDGWQAYGEYGSGTGQFKFFLEY